MNLARLLAIVAAIGGVLLTAGCDTLLIPAAGPNAAIVRSGAAWHGPPYGLVVLSPQVIQILEEWGPRSLSATFGDHRPPPEIKLGIGDIVSVTVFEAAAGGLFIPAEAGVRPGNFVTLPNQPIDTRGNLTVPYAGLVPAAGKTPAEISKEIVNRIKDRAIEPQVEVALVTQNSSLITVIGEINTSTTASPTGRVPAQWSGERILDVITRAGGLRDQGQDTWVVLERNGRRSAVPFGSIIYEPGNNIWAWPGDTIYLYKEAQTFLAFGATGIQGQFPFSAGTAGGALGSSSAWRMTLAEGVAASGGLLDLQADPGSVFLYRREPRELAERLGVDCSKMDGPTVPVVYSTTFADPSGYFLATRFQMHNKDVIFVANAQSVDITKFANFVNTLISVPNNVVSLGNNIQTNRILFATPAHQGVVSTTTTVTTPAPTTSDIRLKHDIVLLGRLANGLGFYRFSYNGSNKIYVGVMAQEVEAVMPQAVTRGRDGYLRVYYEQLGLRLQSWSEWLAEGGNIPTTPVDPDIEARERMR
jgi:polysaccharide biosynthesis/export protein